MKRIGFDVDGILADFCTSYFQLYRDLTGKDLFQPGDAENPPNWDCDLVRGYTKDEQDLVWKYIKSSTSFWMDLTPLPGVSELRDWLANQPESGQPRYYFITNRCGVDCERQTAAWLEWHLEPLLERRAYKVIVTPYKGTACQALALDAYIDDKLENIHQVVGETDGETEAFLLNYRHNAETVPLDFGEYKRVTSLKEMLDQL